MLNCCLYVPNSRWPLKWMHSYLLALNANWNKTFRPKVPKYPRHHTETYQAYEDLYLLLLAIYVILTAYWGIRTNQKKILCTDHYFSFLLWESVSERTPLFRKRHIKFSNDLNEDFFSFMHRVSSLNVIF